MFAGTGYAKPYAIPSALAKLWAEAGATDDPDAQDISAMLGGRWSAASVYRELEQLRLSSPRFRAQLAREAEAADAAAAAGPAARL